MGQGSSWSAPARIASDFEVATLERIRDLLKNQSSRSMNSLLRRLWQSVMPPEVDYQLHSPLWSKLG